MHRRVSAMEEYIEKRVEERLDEEIEHVLGVLEKHLPADEFRRVLEVMAGWEEERADLIIKYPAYGGSFSDREIAPYR